MGAGRGNWVWDGMWHGNWKMQLNDKFGLSLCWGGRPWGIEVAGGAAEVLFVQRRTRRMLRSVSPSTQLPPVKVPAWLMWT